MADQDQDPTRRKDKRKADEYEDGESSAVRRRVVTEVSGQSGGGDGIPGPGNPGQDAPHLVNQNQPHGHLMLMGQQSGVAPSRQAAARQQLPQYYYPPMSAQRPTGQQRGEASRGPSAFQNWCPGLQLPPPPPQAQGGPPVPGASGPLQIRDRGNPGQDAPLLVNQNQPHGHLMGQQPMGSLPQSPLFPQPPLQIAADIEENRRQYWRTVWEVTQLCQDPMMRRRFQDRDQHYKATHPSPFPEDQRCPNCRYYERRMEDLPWRHDCPCDICIVLYAVVCMVCTMPQAAAPAGMGLPGQDQPAVASRPVRQRGVAAAAQIGQPVGLHQPRQQAHPVFPADQAMFANRPTGQERREASLAPPAFQNPNPVGQHGGAPGAAPRGARRGRRPTRASSAPRRPARSPPHQ